MEIAMFGVGPTEILLVAIVVGIIVLIVRGRKS